MRTFVCFATLVTVAALLGGCLDSREGDALSTSPEPPLVEYGRVAGAVLDDELRPLEGAVVEIPETGHRAVTGPDGTFVLEDVPAGAWEVWIHAEGHASAVAEVRVPAGGTGEIEFRVPVLPELAPRTETIVFDGRFDCAAEALILTGDCMIVAEIALGQDPVTEEAHEFDFPVATEWESLVFEMAWENGADNQLDGMRMYIEHSDLSLEGHSEAKIARIDAPEGPLRLEIQRGQPHATAETPADSSEPAQVDLAGETLLIRAFPRGMLYEETSQHCLPDYGCLLGAGAGLDLTFTVYATAFYHMSAPPGFSAMPTAA
jgi:hypothetical protein